jgi:hypothetical protein
MGLLDRMRELEEEARRRQLQELATPESYDPATEYEDRATRERRPYRAPSTGVYATMPAQTVTDVLESGAPPRRLEITERRNTLRGVPYPTGSMMGSLASYFAQALKGDVPLTEEAGSAIANVGEQAGLPRSYAETLGERYVTGAGWTPVIANQHFAEQSARDLMAGRPGRAAWNAALAVIGPDAMSIHEAARLLALRSRGKQLHNVFKKDLDPYLEEAIKHFPSGKKMKGLMETMKEFVKHPRQRLLASPLKNIDPTVLELIRTKGLQWAVNTGVIGEETEKALHDLGYIGGHGEAHHKPEKKEHGGGGEHH